MKGKIVHLLLLAVLLLACKATTLTPVPGGGSPMGTSVSEVVTSTPVIEPSPTVPPSDTPSPLPTDPVPLSVTDAPTPTETPAPVPLQDRLAERIASDEWNRLGLSVERAALWEDFSAGTTELTVGEMLDLEVFIAQWERLEALAEQALIPDNARLGFRVAEPPGLQGDLAPVVYAVDERETQNEVSEHIFMSAYDWDGQGVGLVLAPQIDSLSQRLSPDGETVQYIDQNGVQLLAAEARFLEISSPHQGQLDESLRGLYGWSEYGNRAIYPRYHYLLPGMESSFYALEENLSYNQILLLRETLELFARPGLSAFKPAIFHEGVAYIFYDNIDIAAGMTYSGTGVVGIDRRDLFGNKYALASVLAHEGAHVIQGSLEERTCEAVMRREVGDHTIPPDFYNWTAEELLEAVEGLRVGAYHVSLWMLNELGVGQPQWLIDIIHTGTLNGQSVVLCGPDK